MDLYFLLLYFFIITFLMYLVLFKYDKSETRKGIDSISELIAKMYVFNFATFEAFEKKINFDLQKEKGLYFKNNTFTVYLLLFKIISKSMGYNIDTKKYRSTILYFITSYVGYYENINLEYSMENDLADVLNDLEEYL